MWQRTYVILAWVRHCRLDTSGYVAVCQAYQHSVTTVLQLKYSHGVSQVQVQGMAVPSFMHLENLWSARNSSIDIWEVKDVIPRRFHSSTEIQSYSLSLLLTKVVVSKFLVSQARPHQIEQKTQLFFFFN